MSLHSADKKFNGQPCTHKWHTTWKHNTSTIYGRQRCEKL